MDAVDVKFFNGQVTAFQPKTGYRAGTDALLLAASLSGKPGERFLELGAGSGAACLLAAYHNPDCQFSGLDQSEDMLVCAQMNIASHQNIEVFAGSIGSLPKDWHLQFDQVFTNPPYFDDGKTVRMSKTKSPSFVNTETLGVDDWVRAMLLALKPRGVGTLMYRADRMEKVLSALAGKAGRLRILPIHSFADKPAKRVIIQFRKGVKSESTLLPALVLHERNAAEKFTPKAMAIINGKRKIKL